MCETLVTFHHCFFPKTKTQPHLPPILNCYIAHLIWAVPKDLQAHIHAFLDLLRIQWADPNSKAYSIFDRNCYANKIESGYCIIFTKPKKKKKKKITQYTD